jgi:cyanamide hydratase
MSSSPTNPSNPAIALYGWQAVPSDLTLLLKLQSESSDSPAPVYSISQLARPDDELSNAVYEYAKRELPKETFNHSMRVFYYGM